MGVIRRTIKGLVEELFQGFVKETQRQAQQIFNDSTEARRCWKYILIHNADKWVQDDRQTEGFSLAERVTSAIHRSTHGMAMVIDAFDVGKGRDNTGPTSAFVTFGSVGHCGHCEEWWTCGGPRSRSFLAGVHSPRARSMMPNAWYRRASPSEIMARWPT